MLCLHAGRLTESRRPRRPRRPPATWTLREWRTKYTPQSIVPLWGFSDITEENRRESVSEKYKNNVQHFQTFPPGTGNIANFLWSGIFCCLLACYGSVESIANLFFHRRLQQEQDGLTGRQSMGPPWGWGPPPGSMLPFSWSSNADPPCKMHFVC